MEHVHTHRHTHTTPIKAFAHTLMPCGVEAAAAAAGEQEVNLEACSRCCTKFCFGNVGPPNTVNHSSSPPCCFFLFLHDSLFIKFFICLSLRPPSTPPNTHTHSRAPVSIFRRGGALSVWWERKRRRTPIYQLCQSRKRKSCILFCGRFTTGKLAARPSTAGWDSQSVMRRGFQHTALQEISGVPELHRNRQRGSCCRLLVLSYA